MKLNWLKYILWTIGLVLFQTLVFNHIAFYSYINPYIYILLIMMLPINMSKQFVLVYAFLLGLIVDFFGDSAGLHAGASCLLALGRNYLLKFVKPREGYENDEDITLFNMGFQNFLVYGGILTTIHHFYLFFLEAFKWDLIFEAFSKAVLSSIVTLLMLILTQYLFMKKKLR